MGGTALAAVSEPEVYWDGNSAASGRIYDYDLADGSLVVKWSKQTGASKYYAKCVGLNEKVDFGDDYQSGRGTVLAEKTATTYSTTKCKFSLTASKMEDYDYLKIAVAVYDADDTAQWLTFGIRLKDSRGYSEEPTFKDYPAGKIHDFDTSSGSALTVSYSAANAEAYCVKAILLNEEPSDDSDQASHAVDVIYEVNDRTSKYVRLSASKLTGAKYLKVAVGAYGTKESASEAHWAWVGFRLINSGAADMTLSDSALSFACGGGSDKVTVGGVSSYTVSYPTESETAAGNKWLTVSKSGSAISVSARANYSASSRSETITVESADGQTKTIKVTQDAGYAAPEATVKIGDTVYKSGDTYGPLANGGRDTLWLCVEAKNAQRIHVDCGDSGIGSKTVTLSFSASATSNDCPIQIPAGTTPGTYTFTIYVSNSDVENDSWRQAITPVKLNVQVIDPSADPYPAYGSTLVAVAESQIGYKGSASSSNLTGANVSIVGDYTKYGAYTGANGQHWCASFVAWCANKAGVSGVNRTAEASPGALCGNAYSKGGVVYFLTLNDTQRANHPYLEKYGITKDRSEEIPAVGDLIFFRWSDAGKKVTFSHVGIVSGVSGGNVYYIDGNGPGDVVKKRNKSLTDSTIAAYCKISGSFGAGGATAEPTPTATPAPVIAGTPVFSGYAAYSVNDYDLAKDNLAIYWNSTNAVSYHVKAILLNEVPVANDDSQADRAVRVVRNIDTASNSMALSVADLTGGQYLKFAVGASADGQSEFQWSWIGFKLSNSATAPTAQPTKAPGTNPPAQPTEAPSPKPPVQPTEAPSTNPPAQPTEAPGTNPPVNRIPGDANSDGKVTTADVLQLLKYVSGWGVEVNAANSDVTGDGKITTADVLLLLKYVSGWGVTLQ